MLQRNSSEHVQLGGVIFDVDDTLVASEEFTHQTLCEAAACFGYELDLKTLADMTGKSWKDIGTMLRAAIPDKAVSEAVLQNCNSLLEARLARIKPARTSGSEEILDWLDEVRLPKAIASSADRAWIDLVLGDVRRRFEVVIANEDVIETKPSPEPFLAAAGKIGVAPERCIVVGDSENDVVGARRAGMFPVLVPARTRPAAHVVKMAHAVADSLKDVRDYLQDLWTGGRQRTAAKE